jgi:hypothetical protein
VMKSILAVVLSSYVVFGAETEVGGIENCYNKCNKVFDKTQYAISDQPNSTT